MLVEDIRPRDAEGGRGPHDRDGDRRDRGDKRNKSHKHKSRGSGISKTADQPMRVKTYPCKPTLQQQLLLVQKLLQWRRFIEGGEMGEVVGADEQLLRLISCLDTWLGRRAAAAAEAAAAGDPSDEATAAAAAEAEREVGNLVVTQQGGAGDEEEGTSGSGSLERLSIEALGRGRLPTTLEALWVCAALGGQPTVGSDNKRWIWLAEPSHLPVSWLRRQLKLLLRALTDERLRTAAALQEEADALAEMVEQERQQQLQQQQQEEEQRRLQQQQEEDEKRRRRQERRKQKRRQRQEDEDEEEELQQEERAGDTDAAAESSSSEFAVDEEESEVPDPPQPQRSKKKKRERRRSHSASPEASPVKPEPAETVGKAETPSAAPEPQPAAGAAAASPAATPTAAPTAGATAAATAAGSEEEETDAFAAWIRDIIEQPGGVSSAAAAALPESLQKFIAQAENEQQQGENAPPALQQQQPQQQQQQQEMMDDVGCATLRAVEDGQPAAGAGDRGQQETARGKRVRITPSPEELRELLRDCYRLAETGVSPSSITRHPEDTLPLVPICSAAATAAAATAAAATGCIVHGSWGISVCVFVSLSVSSNNRSWRRRHSGIYSVNRKSEAESPSAAFCRRHNGGRLAASSAGAAGLLLQGLYLTERELALLGL